MNLFVPIIAKLVEKAITVHLLIRGELNRWWDLGQYGLHAGWNIFIASFWMVRSVFENTIYMQHTAVLLVDVSAPFSNTSRYDVTEILKNNEPGIDIWVNTWLVDYLIVVELDRNCDPLRSLGSSQRQGSPLLLVLFGLICQRIFKELPDGCSYVDDCAWSIPFDSVSDKNELASNVHRLLNKIQAVSHRHVMELDKKKTELAAIYKANQISK
jgi:hypothetical protein